MPKENTMDILILMVFIGSIIVCYSVWYLINIEQFNFTEGETFGIFLATVAIIFAIDIPIVFERIKRPVLSVEYEDSPIDPVANRRFLHAVVMNRTSKILDRNPAYNTKVRLGFYSIDNEPLLNGLTVEAKWSNAPECRSPSFSIFLNAPDNIEIIPATRVYDETKVPFAQSRIIYSGEREPSCGNFLQTFYPRL